MMEESVEDLLRNAFAEESVPSFHERDLDFENTYLDEKCEEDTSIISYENTPTKEKETLHQEVERFCFTDITKTAENLEEELPDGVGFQGEAVTSAGKSQEECSTSSGEDSPFSSEDEEHEEDDEDGEEDTESGRWLMSAHTGQEYHRGSKGDGGGPSVERRPLPPEGDGNTPVRNKAQGESESDEMSYFQRVPEHGNKSKRTEDDEKEMEGIKPESEGPKSEEEEEEEEEDDQIRFCFKWKVQNSHRDNPAGDILGFPELMVQHQQDLIVEGDDGDSVEKIKDFSGEEHQEAGESFAEYPSDFSPCEYIEDGENDKESYSQRAGHRGTFQRLTESEAFVGSRGRELEAETMSGDVTGMRCETSDSYTSSDDETQTTSDEELDVTSKDVEKNSQLEEHHSGSRLCAHDCNADQETSLFPNYLLAADKQGFPDVTTCAAEGVRMSSGSRDDSFFISEELQDSQISELGELADEEYEERSNWEQEQERIRAFNKFYDNSDQLTGEEGRQTKVQFCTELCSQMLLYELDSSDGGSLSSSTEGEEELGPAETPEESREPEDGTEMTPTYDIPITQAESVSHLGQPQKRGQRCLDILKVTLKMGVITVTGLLMLWWATDQTGWLRG